MLIVGWSHNTGRMVSSAENPHLLFLNEPNTENHHVTRRKTQPVLYKSYHFGDFYEFQKWKWALIPARFCPSTVDQPKTGRATECQQLQAPSSASPLSPHPHTRQSPILSFFSHKTGEANMQQPFPQWHILQRPITLLNNNKKRHVITYRGRQARRDLPHLFCVNV